MFQLSHINWNIVLSSVCLTHLISVFWKKKIKLLPFWNKSTLISYFLKKINIIFLLPYKINMRRTGICGVFEDSGFSQTFFQIFFQRQRSVPTLCDKPEWKWSVCGLWRQQGTQLRAWSDRVLQDKSYWTVWRVPDIFLFWGTVWQNSFLSHFLFR